MGSFAVARLSSIAIGGKLYLVIAQEVSPWKDSKEIEQKNRSLIKLFADRFPEYSSVFGGFVAEATERGGTNGWRTVSDNSALHRYLTSRVKWRDLAPFGSNSFG